MTERLILNRRLNSKIFREYYYLKEELVTFCRNEGLATGGGKIEDKWYKKTDLIVLTIK
jgi:hypothetical protein